MIAASGVVTQFDMKCVEKVGMVKFDLLGLKTLTQIQYCLELIKNLTKESGGSDLISKEFSKICQK